MSEEMPLLTPDMAPITSLQDIARAQIKHWIVSSGTTQAHVCAEIGRNQPWLSRYLSGEIDADLDTLAQIAKVFEHSLFALLSVPSDPEDAVLIRMYRAMRPEGRRAFLGIGREMTRDRSR
jgi:transcriptional regulator with XRE-family HTH domain